MDKERMARYTELEAKLKSDGGLIASEREEHRLLHMEYLADMMASYEDDEAEE